MGCTHTKKPDQRVEKTLTRLGEKEKQLDMLIKQHQDLISKYEQNSLQGTQKIPNGSTNELKQNLSIPQTKEQNILPQNILEKEDGFVGTKKNLQESNTQVNDHRQEKSEKTLEKINHDIYNNNNNNKSTSNNQKTNEMNVAINKDHTGSQNGQQLSTQQNIIGHLDDNNSQNKQGTQVQKLPSGQQPQHQQLIHVIQSEQVYNSNNIIRITEDNEDYTIPTDKRQSVTQQRNPQSIARNQPTQRLSREGQDGERKQTDDEVLQWVNLIQAFDDVSIRPIDNFQEKEQPLSTDQIELDLGSLQKTSKSNGLPMQSPPPYINNIYNTLPNNNGQNRMFNNNTNTSEQIQRPKTTQTSQFEHLIHHPDIMKVYEKVQQKILVKNENNEKPQGQVPNKQM